MSFIKASDVIFARDLWPSGIGRPIRDIDNETTLEAWRIMPYTLDELSAWAILEAESARVNGVRRMVFVYEPSIHEGRNGCRCQVTFRLQGFITSVNLNPLGDWNGRDHDAPRAIQHLILADAGFHPPFVAQHTAMVNIQTLILGALGADVSDIAVSEGKIELKRRVFTRVRPMFGSSVRSALRAGDDPTGKAGRISSRWLVLHRVTTGVQHGDGTIRPTSHLAFRKGDFVDVAVFVEVVTRRSKSTNHTDINFAMQHVVRLYSVAELKGNVKAAMSNIDEPQQQEGTEEGNSGFTYGNNPDSGPSTSKVPELGIENIQEDEDMLDP